MSGPSPRLAPGAVATAAGVVAIATLLSRVFGVGRWLAFSDGVGATCVGQAYATANQVPNVLFEVAAGGALAAVAVPVVSSFLHRGQGRAADQVASALLSWACCVLLPLSVLVAVLAGPLTAALLGSAHGCGPEAGEAGRLMLVIFAPQVFLYGVGIVLSGVLQAHRRFLAAAVTPLLSSVVVIVTYLAYGARVADGTPLADTPREAVLLLAGGTTLGVVALSLPLLVPTWRAGIRLRPTLAFPDGTGRWAARLAAAGVLVVAAQQACVLITVWLANRSGDVGTINSYTYAQTVYLLPYAVLVVPLATAVFPRFTDTGQASRLLTRALSVVGAVGVSAAVALVAVRREVGTVFHSLDAGAAGAGTDALDALPAGLAAYAPGLLGFAVMALLTRALYARGSTSGAAVAAGGGWLLAGLAPLAVLGARPGIGARDTLIGLGLGSTAGMTLAAVGLLVLVARGWGSGVVRPALRPTAWATAGALAVLLLRELLSGVLAPTGWVAAIAVAVGCTVLTLAASGAAVRIGDPGTWSTLAAGLRRAGGRLGQ